LLTAAIQGVLLPWRTFAILCHILVLPFESGFVRVAHQGGTHILIGQVVPNILDRSTATSTTATLPETMSQGHKVVRLRPGCSDGDALHVPKQGTLTQVSPPTLYLEKIGPQWMKNRGEAQPGVKYILEALPNGYTMWQRPRPSAPKHVDKYLYGHPSHKVFDSPNRFYPHFEHLMENNGSSIGCPCTVCAGSSGVLPRSSSNSIRPGSSSSASSRTKTTKHPKPISNLSRPLQGSTLRPSVVSGSTRPLAPAVQPMSAAVPINQLKGRPKLIKPGADNTHVDEEGTPDVYRNLVDKLRRHDTIDEIIEQPLSPDWRIEQKVLPGMLQTLKKQDQWLPRVGDIVLYLRDLPGHVEIMRHEETGEYNMYDEKHEELIGTPPWEAGLVGEVPAEPTAIADLHRSEAETSVIYSGVRVEPLPNPNSVDKSLSKRYKYVPLRQTRPFALWNELLAQIPKGEWHATIMNALTVISTVSLLGKYRFRGTWPEASIYCYGVHIGSELLVVGDTVRLLPSASKFQTRCTDVLVIKTIRLKWSNLDLASTNDYDDGRPYNSEVFLYGSAYTNDPTLMNKEYMSNDNSEPPRAASAYGEWYPLHPSSKELVLPYSRIAGRLYEQDAMSFWLNSDPDDRPDLDVGREGLMEARAFARQHDQRISKEPGATWYWGDDRADALNLRTINSLEVTKFDQNRDIRAMRKSIKTLDGEDTKPTTAAQPTAPNTMGSRDLRRFMAPGSDLPDAMEGVKDLSMNDSVNGSSSSAEGSAAGKKRPHVINLSDDEDDMEVMQNTRIVDDVPGKKKARVAVVIKRN
jgi:hypothetical protein